MSELESPGKKVLRGENPRIKLVVTEGESQHELDGEYSLDQCVAAYDGVMPVTRPVNDNEQGMLGEYKALPYFYYVLLRGLKFSIELLIFLAVYCVVNLGLQHLTPAFADYDSLIFPAVYLIVSIGIKYFSSTVGWFSRRFGLRVVGSNGEKLNRSAGVIRSVVFSLTWFLLPVQLLFIATGSRRFLHDYVSGSYVLFGKEDLNTTFYPPTKHWVAGLFIMASIYVISLKPTDLPPSFQYFAMQQVVSHSGKDSRASLNALESIYANFDPDYSHLSADDAQSLKYIFEEMARLRQEYYGAGDMRLSFYWQTIYRLDNKANP